METPRIGSRLPIGEFARVLGGGIVPGSIVLIGGDPGIGKSTLVLQMAIEMAARQRVLYVSGEEFERQIKMRATRLAAEGRQLPSELLLVTETNLAVILEHVAESKPAMVIIDSIQTVYLAEMDSSAGSVSQVRECASRLRELAKSNGVTVFLIGHVTKEGAIAGPRVLEHIVDTVLYLEGDRFQAYRLLRSVKNRFGATSEVGVFEMREGGLAEVPNPSEVFLAERMANAPGSAIAVIMEGTRPILVEIQGLTSPAQFGNARRTPNGVDVNRLLLIAAVLTRRAGLRLGDQDLFVNVVGGIQVDEPAADLAIAVAIASSSKDAAVRAGAVLSERSAWRENCACRARWRRVCGRRPSWDSRQPSSPSPCAALAPGGSRKAGPGAWRSLKPDRYNRRSRRRSCLPQQRRQGVARWPDSGNRVRNST